MTKVIYHKADFDGIFCREIAKRYLPGAELIGWDYGDPTPVVDQKDDIFILDLSVPELMTHPRLVWIDHHKSAIDKYSTTIPGYRIDGVAACRLAWQWFDDKGSCQDPSMLPSKQEFIDRKVKEPYAIRLAGEYDIWDKRDSNAELFQHGLRSRELNENMWDLMLVNEDAHDDGVADCGTITVRALLEAGESIQYAKTHENASIITNQSFTLQWEGLTFLCCNHARFNSHLFTAALRPEHDACLGFCWDGRKWKVSLYHASGHEHHDLSVIASKHQGGGHRGACGFTCNTLPFPLTSTK